MVIKAAAGRQVDALVAALASDSEVAREAAVARLTVIGTRAVERLVRVVESPETAAPARVAALRALDAIGDPRALGAAAAAAASREPAAAVAAMTMMRGFLHGPRGAEAVDRLTAAALDQSGDVRVRTAAVSALADLDPETRRPLWTRLAEDAAPAIRQAVAAAAPDRTAASPASVDTMADRPLPDDPEGLRRALARAPVRTPLAALQRLVERLREREAAAPVARRSGWAAARAAAHLALARRNSRLALYDLREWLAGATGPLPVDAVAALERIGDTSCLEPIAAAYARSAAAAPGPHDWWREHLAGAFHAIAARERLTRRHAVMKKIATRWGLPG